MTLKRTELKRKPRSRIAAEGTYGPDARAWRIGVIRGGCVMCRSFPVPRHLRPGRHVELATLQGHHIIGKRHLKRERLTHLYWEPVNGLCLCEYHHGRHERAVQRVPRMLLPGEAIAWAVAFGFESVLDREYGW